MNVTRFPNKKASMLPGKQSPRYLPAVDEAANRLCDTLCNALIEWCDAEGVDINHVTTLAGVGLFAQEFVESSELEDQARGVLRFFIKKG